MLTVGQPDKHYTFESPNAASSDGSATSASAQEWLDIIERSREIALSQSISANNHPLSTYSDHNDALKDLQDATKATAGSTRGLDLDSPAPPSMMLPDPSSSGSGVGGGRHKLEKLQAPEREKGEGADGSGGGGGGFMGRKRFSKRQSKSGLAAVF